MKRPCVGQASSAINAELSDIIMNALTLDENHHECKETRRKLSSFSFPTPGNLVLTLDPGLAITLRCTKMRQLENIVK